MIFEFDEVISCVEKVYVLEFMSVNNCMSLGDIYYCVGQYVGVLVVFEDFWEKYLDNVMVRDMLGFCYLMIG